jgi:hypothetical protein
MKNLLLFSFLTSALISCQKEQLIVEEGTAKEKANKGFRVQLLSYQSYVPYGQLHNDYLTNVQDNFTNSTTAISLSEAIDYVANFNQSYTNTITTLSNNEKQIINAGITEFKDFVVSETFMEYQMGPNGRFYQDINTAYNNGSIDEFEKNTLISIGQKSYDVYSNPLTIQDLEIYLNAIKAEWEGQQYTTNDVHGRLTPAILAISLESANWWSNHPDAYPNNSSTVLAAPIANDVAGAAVGALVQAGKEIVNDDIQGGGTLEGAGSRIANAAVTGAVVGSTGVVGKVANFIKSFF